MRKLISAVAIVFLMITQMYAQQVQKLSYADLNKIVTKADGKAKLINFWATWCKPCVDELPEFVKAESSEDYKNIDFIFVSVDFQSQNEKVIQKAHDLNMQGSIVHLDERGSEWIEAMDKDWEGAIPYTILILPDGKRVSHYDSFENFDALKSFLDTNLPN